MLCNIISKHGWPGEVNSKQLTQSSFLLVMSPMTSAWALQSLYLCTHKLFSYCTGAQVYWTSARKRKVRVVITGDVKSYISILAPAQNFRYRHRYVYRYVYRYVPKWSNKLQNYSLDRLLCTCTATHVHAHFISCRAGKRLRKFWKFLNFNSLDGSVNDSF